MPETLPQEELSVNTHRNSNPTKRSIYHPIMGSAPPPSFFDIMLGTSSSSAPSAPASAPAPQPPPVLEPALDPLPGVPRWHLDPLPQNPRGLHDDQLEFLSDIMAQEITDHNNTRARMQRYLSLSLKHERDLFCEQGTVRYLNYVVGDLRWQLQNEKVKRVMAEQEKQQALVLWKNSRCEVHARATSSTSGPNTQADNSKHIPLDCPMCLESLDLPSPAVFDAEVFGNGVSAEDCAGPSDPTNTAFIDPKELTTTDSACAEIPALDEEERAVYAVPREGGGELEEIGTHGKRKASSSPSLWGEEGMGRPSKRCKH
ncbi:hypothetical protein F5882DRAFT_461549 [Hyaloscypha sp. PMI_1271]|nr:hypothetical protein F5882DRAFT_461549 [Hyaloscypha sp. PMI_1271]